MRIPLIVAAAAALTFTASLSQATVINSAYTSLGGNSWLVDFTLVNDGNPASFAGFTIDLPNAINLTKVASPSTWDSNVYEQDLGLPDDAYLESFAIDPSNIWGAGQSIGGFEVSFDYTAGATPGALPFMLFNANFDPVFAGTTVAAIPEPATVVLTALGLGLVALHTRRKSTRNCNTSTEVAA